MTANSHKIRMQRILREAEGYLELSMPQSALTTLTRAGEAGTFRGHLCFLQGEALRALDRHAEALEVLLQAADLAPSNIAIWLALGWCHKRVGRLDLAIEDLRRALEIEPNEAVLHYNLACYWSLSGQKNDALRSLHRALELDSKYRLLLHDETDFDPIRSDPDFQSLIVVNV